MSMQRATNYGQQSMMDQELVIRLNQFYIQARTKKSKLYDTWRRNYMLYHNKMFSDLRPQWTPNASDSEIMPVVNSVIGWMMDQDVSFSVNPAVAPHDPYASYLGKLSNDLEQVLESNWTVQCWDKQIGLGIFNALLYGTGIIKSIWDIGSDQGLGNAKIKSIDPYTFYPDPNATCADDMQFCVEVKRLSFEQIQRQYPLAYDKVLQNAMWLDRGGGDIGDAEKPQTFDSSKYPIANPGAIPGGTAFGETWTNVGSGSYGLPGQGKRSTNINSLGINVYEFWLRENYIEPNEQTDPVSVMDEAPNVTDQWRVVVMAAGCILMDELARDLFEISRHPYSFFCFEDDGDFWGTALVSHLVPAQIAINRLLSTLQQNAELTGNPIWIEGANSGIARTRVINRAGQRLQTSGNLNPGNEPHWLIPPNMPSYIQGLIEFWIGRMENISGLSGVNKGQAPAPRTTGSTVTSVQESGFVRIRQGLRNLEYCLRDVGTMVSQLIIQNYTVPRTVAILGQQGMPSALALSANHFYAPTRASDGKLITAPMKYALLVTAGANNPTSRSARIAEIDTLFAMGAVDAEAVLEVHNVPNYQVILQRMQENARNQAINAALSGHKAGGAPGARVRAARNS